MNLRKVDVALLGDAIVPVKVDEGPLVYCLTGDAALLESCRDSEPPTNPRLLAPLDPLIYDRKLTLKLWDFDFT